jgi:hypothetical protein
MKPRKEGAQRAKEFRLAANCDENRKELRVNQQPIAMRPKSTAIELKANCDENRQELRLNQKKRCN